MSLTSEIAKIATIDLFKKDSATGLVDTGLFVGRPFHLDYSSALLLVADAWKQKAQGLPQGSLLLAYYENEDDVSEALLLRVIAPAKLPTDSDVIGAMVEYYKDNLKTSGKESQLDTFTRYEFGFSGVQSRILGTFYKDSDGNLNFGADVENFYSSHNYRVIKPNPQVLEAIVNFREGNVSGNPTDIKIGRVRYSSSRRFQTAEQVVPVFVSPRDFLGKRTALFGMTRTGKSNTVKKIIQSSVLMGAAAPLSLSKPANERPEDALEPFTKAGVPKYPVGQIIFDINGEYANANMQDEGTAIFELYKEQTIRFSTIPKNGFKVMKVNFYRDVSAGFELVRGHLAQSVGNYIDSFRVVDFQKPDDYDTNQSAKTRYDRKVAAYMCCLYRAGFKAPPNFRVRFSGNAKLNELVQEDGSIDPSKGITLDQAVNWFTTIWDSYEEADFFNDYKRKHGHEWADEDLKSILVFLSRKRKPGGNADVDGYIKLRGIVDLHTEPVDKPFEVEIVKHLRAGRNVIIHLSQ